MSAFKQQVQFPLRSLLITECSEKACNYLTAFLKQMLLRCLLLVGFFFFPLFFLSHLKQLHVKHFLTCIFMRVSVHTELFMTSLTSYFKKKQPRTGMENDAVCALKITKE